MSRFDAKIFDPSIKHAMKPAVSSYLNCVHSSPVGMAKENGVAAGKVNFMFYNNELMQQVQMTTNGPAIAYISANFSEQ
jgi:hypothetical protein